MAYIPVISKSKTPKPEDDPLFFTELIDQNIAKIIHNASQPIAKPKPLLKLNGEDVMWFNSINIIQGKCGSHKSRLTEIFASLFLKASDCATDFLGFAKDESKFYTVAYVDTERNLQNQFPYAIQQIRKKAGFNPEENLETLIPFSLLEVDRENRLKCLKAFIKGVAEGNNYYKIIILDVVTDCIGDFNSAHETLKLYDYLNRLISDYDITIILVIHENPGTEKARGHLGTEGANKASTQIQIGFVQSKGEDTDLIRVKFLKSRGGRKPQPFHVVYDQESQGLILADPEEIDRVQKGQEEEDWRREFANVIGSFINGECKQQELVGEIMAQCGVSLNTAKTRLKEMEDNKYAISKPFGKIFYLVSKTQNGKPTIYSLIPAEK